MPKYQVIQGRHYRKGEDGSLEKFEADDQFFDNDDELDVKFPNKFRRINKPGRPKKKAGSSGEASGASTSSGEGGSGG